MSRSPDLGEELSELCGAVTGVAFADDTAGGDVEGGEQRDDAMTLVVVAQAGRLTRPHRQQGLTAIERLYLALLVDAQHHCSLRRRNVQADDVAHLGHEVGISRELEGLQPMRLQAKGTPDPLHDRRRQSARFGHAARTPMGRVLGHAFQRLDDNRFNARIIDGSRRSGATRVAKSLEPMLKEPSAPLAHRVLVDLLLRGNLPVLQALRASQHDPRSQCQRLSRLATCCQRFQLRSLRFVQLQRS